MTLDRDEVRRFERSKLEARKSFSEKHPNFWIGVFWIIFAVSWVAAFWTLWRWR